MFSSISKSLSEPKWLTLIIVNLATFMAPLDTGIVSLVLPSIARDFKTGIEIAIWVPVIYLLILTVFMTSFGRYSDINGRKKFFIIGLGIFVVGSFLSGISQTIAELLIFRIIQAIGATLLLVNSRAIITDAFPPEERRLAMSIHVTVIYIAIASGPALGSIISEYIGWRNVFFLNVPLGLCLIPITYSKLIESKQSLSKSMDWLGSVLFALTLSTLLIAITFGPKENWTTIDVYIEQIYLPLFGNFHLWSRIFISIPLMILPVLSLIFLILFVIVESKVKYPVLDLKMLRHNRLFLSTNLSALFMYTAHFNSIILFSFYLQLIRLFDPIEAAFMISAFPLTVVIVSILVGKYSNLISSRELSVLGMSIVAIALLLMSRITLYSSILFIETSLIILGIGLSLFAAPNTNANLSSVAPDQRSLANGMLGTMRHMGQSLSLAIGASVVGIFLSADIYNVGGSVSAVQYVQGLSQSFLIGALVAIVGIFVALIRGKDNI